MMDELDAHDENCCTSHDREISPEETIEKMRPHFSNLGITRLADQTNLDTLKIPCFASFRPNSKTLSTNQGKGVSVALAKASAVMEAVEFAVAENPSVKCISASTEQIIMRGEAFYSPDRFLPDQNKLDQNSIIRWCAGTTLWSNRQVWVPLDLVSLNGAAKDLPGVCQTTNGLASGNTKTEAIFHAVCELIERHGNTLWLLRSDEARHHSCFDHAKLNNPIIDNMVTKITHSNMTIQLFDQTIDVNVPVIMAVIGEKTPFNGYFEVAAGYGAHPSPVRAAIRAITEAAQTRITSIAAARDDIEPGTHLEEMSTSAKAILEIAPHPETGPPKATNGNHNSNSLLSDVSNSMKKASLGEPIVVELTDKLPCSVVRVLSPDLEDFEANIHWQIGERAEAWIGR